MGITYLPSDPDAPDIVIAVDEIYSETGGRFTVYGSGDSKEAAESDLMRKANLMRKALHTPQ